MRKICYVTGTRADFGLMQSTLKAIQAHPDLELSLIATGMHLLAQFGRTIIEIERAGLPIAAEVPVDMEPANGATMAKNIGHMLVAFVDALEGIRPDLVLLLGDRGEMLAGALAAIHLNIPIAHIHGGERSGTVDDPVRHAISKLAHFHFAATANAAQRLVSMGELPEHVLVTGAPGLDGLQSLAHIGRAQLCEQAGLVPDRPVALLVFHPVLQEAESAGSDTECILQQLLAHGLQIVALMPNADAGNGGVRAALEACQAGAGMRVFTHLPRDQFVSWMAAADLMIGNSSAGIIEAGSFGTPVINIGSRQNLRERNSNVIDVVPESRVLYAAIGAALARGKFAPSNVYGDGRSAERIAGLLATLPLNDEILMKSNAY